MKKKDIKETQRTVYCTVSALITKNSIVVEKIAVKCSKENLEWYNCWRTLSFLSLYLFP